jgi:hypothetical protein
MRDKFTAAIPADSRRVNAAAHRLMSGIKTARRVLALAVFDTILLTIYFSEKGWNNLDLLLWS